MAAQADGGRDGEGKILQDLKAQTVTNKDQRQPLLRRLGQRSLLSGNGRPRRGLYVVALALFLAAFLLAYQSVPPLEFNWKWLLVIACLVPLTMFLNGLELVIAGWAVKQRLPVPEAVRLGILATSANLLPIPGSILVRTQVLKEGGSRYREAVRSTGAIGVGWLASSFLLAGMIQGTHRPPVALVLVSLGLASTILVAILLRFSENRAQAMLAILLLEAVFVFVTAIRLYAGFMAIQASVSIDQVLVIAVSSAVASAVGVLPAGLGLRELIAGALSPIVGLSVASGVLVTAIDRLVGMSVFALASLVFLASFPRPRFG